MKGAKGTSGGSKDGKNSKVLSLAVEEVDTVITSAKDLREAKELFRQFDTDGDGTLTMSEIQASLYYNNVDYEEIQAILGPNGIKCSQKDKVSVEDFAQFLCKRRRENANRHQNFQLSKHSRIMRVYVSSCLQQHHAERRVLHDRVFPRLADFCARHGGELRVVDLRYHAGPAEATVSGPGQAEVLQELARVATDANHFFVGLVADLPGESALPAEVSPAEFEILKASAKIFEATGDEKGLVQALEALYAQDLNSPTQAYALRPGPEGDVAMLLRAFSDFDGDDRSLHSSFSKVRAKMARSLSEVEFWRCSALGAELGQAQRAFLFVRTAEDLVASAASPEAPSLQQILAGQAEAAVLHTLERQHLIREAMLAAVPAGNVHQYKVKASAEALRVVAAAAHAPKAMVEVVDPEYLDLFAAQAHDALHGPMLARLRAPAPPPLEAELDAQAAAMKRDAAAIFRYDSDPLVRDVLDYVRGSPERAANAERAAQSTDLKARKRAREELERQPLPGCPLVLTGPTGSGRTALLARVAESLSFSKEAARCSCARRPPPLSCWWRLLICGRLCACARRAGGPRLPARRDGIDGPSSESSSSSSSS